MCYRLLLLFYIATSTLSGAPPLSPIRASDYSYAYWQNSWRKYDDQNFKDILCFETDRFGMKLDIQDIAHPRLGLINSPSNHLDTLTTGIDRLKSLPKGHLHLEIEQGGSTYKLVSCQAAEESGPRRLASVRMWEAGMLSQNFDIQQLIFKNEKDQILATDSTLQFIVWPDSLTLNAHISPSHHYKQGTTMGITGNGICLADKSYVIPKSNISAPQHFTISCWVKIPSTLNAKPYGWILCNKKNESSEGHFGFSINGNNSFSARLNNGGKRSNNLEIRSLGHLEKETWYQLALSYDGQKMRFYLNGKIQGEEDVKNPRSTGTELITLGQRGDKGGHLTKGLYDQVRFWNRPLSANEIHQLNKAPSSPPPTKGLLLNHDFGQGYQPPHWKNTTLRLSLSDGRKVFKTQKKVSGLWKIGQSQELTLNRDFDNTPAQNPALKLSLTTADKKIHPLDFNPKTNSYYGYFKKGSYIKGGYRDIRNYDEYLIKIENTGKDNIRVPVHLHLKNPANMTGLSPMLCHEDGTPTGIPVQLSKNWHYKKLGSYFRPYMILPAKPGQSTYKLRVAYGFFGKLPAASHAQLSLVGYANNTRWDQLAIGCWGETICFDMDQGCVPNTITDVRGLMLRNGKDGKKWAWTDCGWGGDWLHVNQGKKKRLHFAELKTAYHAHGPCLTDVRYDGYFGAKREVDLKAQTHTIRSDDIARTFQNLEYTFNSTIPTKDISFFTLGGRAPTITPHYAYGDKHGVHAHKRIPANLHLGQLVIDRQTINGEGPWWISLPDSRPPLRSDQNNWGNGSRALIIRSYEATFGGKNYYNPTISIPISHDLGKGDKGTHILLTPPKTVTTIQPGDRIKLKIQWVTYPREAGDYYGPNENLRNLLKTHPNHWLPVLRECSDNDLQVALKGGQLLNNYPLLIKAENPELTFTIQGGVGAVPVRIENITDPTDYALYRIINGKPHKLDTTAHGNDDYQLTYNTSTQRYQLTYNIPLDNIPQSTWLFTKTPPKTNPP